MRTSVTSTRFKVKVKVTELLKFWKLHFSRSIYSTIFTWSSKLMVGSDSMWPDLQFVGAQFLNLLLGKLSNFAECRYFMKFKWTYFGTEWGCSHIVGLAGSPSCMVYDDVTLTWCTVKVTRLLKFRKLHFSRSISSAILAWSSKLMVDHDSTGPSLQLVRVQFLNFLFRKLSCELKWNVDITRTSNGHISILLEATVTWSGMLEVLYVLRILMLPWPDPRSRSLTSCTFENCTFLRLPPLLFGVALTTDG